VTQKEAKNKTMIPPTPLIKGGGETGGIKNSIQGGVAGGINITYEEVKERGLIWNGRHLPYNPDNVEKAKELRKNQTKAEKKLWYEFLSEHKSRFLRQRPIDHYIVDFYCASSKLVIEVDGGSHFTEEGSAYDKMRTELLNLYGLKVIRFTNNEVLNKFDYVCKKIDEETMIPPAPLNKGGGETGGIKSSIQGGVAAGINISDKKLKIK